MKRIVFVAPGVAAPWTEGRKNFVRDLAQTLQVEGYSVEVLNGGATADKSLALHKALVLARTLFELRGSLRKDNCPDAVVLFPYGRFTGVVGAANQMFLRLARRICLGAHLMHSTLFYSCAGLSLAKLGARFAPGLAVGRSGNGIGRIGLGIQHPDLQWRQKNATPQRALFLCGYQKATSATLHDVLYERGLLDLLLAGNALAELGMRLTIAIPFLRDKSMVALLQAQAARLCPQIELSLSGDIAPADALMTHDVFIFPYRAEDAVFVPTSLLEAISIGIPVIAADHVMYRELTHDGDQRRCALHHPGDSRDLANVSTQLSRNYADAVVLAARTRGQIREQWTLPRCANELLAALNLRKSGHS